MKTGQIHLVAGGSLKGNFLEQA